MMPLACILFEAGFEKIRMDRNGGIFAFGVFTVHLGELPGHIAIAGIVKFIGYVEVPTMVEFVGQMTI
jgi:hypothetical protein